jgi:hypothetical protein
VLGGSHLLPGPGGGLTGRSNLLLRRARAHRTPSSAGSVLVASLSPKSSTESTAARRRLTAAGSKHLSPLGLEESPFGFLRWELLLRPVVVPIFVRPGNGLPSDIEQLESQSTNCHAVSLVTGLKCPQSERHRSISAVEDGGRFGHRIYVFGHCGCSCCYGCSGASPSWHGDAGRSVSGGSWLLTLPSFRIPKLSRRCSSHWTNRDANVSVSTQFQPWRDDAFWGKAAYAAAFRSICRRP